MGHYGEEKTLDEGFYFLSDGYIYKSLGKSKVKAFRAYFEPKEEAAEVKLFIEDEDMTTAITELDGESLNGKNDVIFNLAGQRVGKAQKGIYIVNGKKIVIK